VVTGCRLRPGVTPLFPGRAGSPIGKDVRNGYKSAAPPADRVWLQRARGQDLGS